MKEFFFKDLMYNNYENMKKHFPGDFNYIPKTYDYPKDQKEIEEIFGNYKLQLNDLWIVKPKNLCAGTGVHIFKSLEEEKKRKNFIISKYLSFPHLINKKKYDMRIYVLVTGFQPLRIYLYKEGLIRIAAEKYKLNIKSF